MPRRNTNARRSLKGQAEGARHKRPMRETEQRFEKHRLPLNEYRARLNRIEGL